MSRKGTRVNQNIIENHKTFDPVSDKKNYMLVSVIVESSYI